MMTKLFVTRHKLDNKLVKDTLFQFEGTFLFQLYSRIALLSLSAGVNQLILRMYRQGTTVSASAKVNHANDSFK
jgi:hypothetical protein